MLRQVACGLTAACLALVPGLAVDASAEAEAPRQGGRALVAVAATAPSTLAGRIEDVVALDERSYFAWLVVERALSGEHASDERVGVAWDERVRDREARFADGDRVLLALEPLPGWSIWRERLGDREALGVGQRGEAFLADPDDATLDGLAAWLAKPPAERESLASLPELAALVATAEPTVARGALDRLARLPGLARGLAEPEGAAASESLVHALLDDDRPDRLRLQIVALAGDRKLEALAPALATLTADAGSGLAPAALASRAALTGGLPPDETAALLDRSEPAVRAAVFDAAPGAVSDAALEHHLESDPDATVRAAAVRVFVDRHGLAAWSRVAPLLDDPNVPEGAAAVRALGGLGEPAAVRIATRARERDLAGARGPLLALTFAGEQGTLALRALAVDHHDPAVRAFASFLLGRAPPEH